MRSIPGTGSGAQTTSAAGCPDLTEDLGFSLMAVAHAYRTAVSPVLAGVARGARGFQTLAAVVEGDGPNQIALAGYLRIDRTVMTYLLDDLVAAGLVERRLDPADRRRRRIVATPLGVETLRDLQRQVRAAEDALLSVLDEDERAVLRSLLARLARTVAEGEPGGLSCDVGPDSCEVGADSCDVGADSGDATVSPGRGPG
ncbi:MarR family winged helix-turn-helix transcriptional regulator [Kitasatospora sp. NPDC056181]|uniref:MarR family winged helix-turn-helix transcriptional regulator n=1 Tax=Kitasatospora sp. NPDC056181 TaxID=3345737 RepID=UPI0035E3634C